MGPVNVALALPSVTMPTGLTLPEELSFEEWAEIGEGLFAAEKAVMWWIGDWWRFGERTYGESAAQAAPTGYSINTLQAAAWVADRVESLRRRKDLSWSHHREVAPLAPDQQEYWLTQAESGEWSRNELRTRVRLGNTEDAPLNGESRSAHWSDLTGLIDALDSLLSSDATALAAAVPTRRRASTAKKLRKLGTGLGRIAWSLEGMEDSDGRPV